MDFSFFDLFKNKLQVAPGFMQASDGEQLAYYVHEADFAKPYAPVLVFYHGGGAYQVEAYQVMAQSLAQNFGISSYLFDVRGHGYSGGPRGDAPSVARVLLDVQEAIVWVKAQRPEARLYIAGHSSGCGLLTHALQQGYVPQDIAGMVFIAPFLGARSKTILKSRFIKKVSVWRFIWHAITGYGLHKPAVFFNYPMYLKNNSPLLLDYYTVAMSLAITPDDADNYLKQFALPLHIVLGSDDKQISGTVFQNLSKQGGLALSTHLTVCEGKGHFSILSSVSEIIAKEMCHD